MREIRAFRYFWPGQKMHYRNKWYADLGEAPLLLALGIHGQYLFVDRQNQLVVVMMSSQANPLDAELISLTMTAVSHIRETLALSQ
jgi:CubicO group peptidase (beta-lactamase class C family)